jgi:hypothetical protein
MVEKTAWKISQQNATGLKDKLSGRAHAYSNMLKVLECIPLPMYTYTCAHVHTNNPEGVIPI